MKIISASWPVFVRAALASLPTTLGLFAFALAVYLALPDRMLNKLHAGHVAISIIGLSRYIWMLTIQFRAIWYIHVTFPKLRAKVNQIPEPCPVRLYILVPSYKEDPVVTKRCVTALMKEINRLPSRVFLLFSVSGPDEINLIHNVICGFEMQNHPEVFFQEQRDGKRMALGQALRAASRDYLRVSDWHDDAHNDIVVLMDGDTELQPGTLCDTLGFFRIMPHLGALTTDEEGHMITPEAARSPINPWFALKFAKRHAQMSAHSLSRRVLTLTGRLSIFRAHPILEPEAIRRVEVDSLSHWVFGNFRFLMGDDKSTWFDLLRKHWEMIYVPDICVNCLETRAGNFFKTSSSLMFRWYGNQARNNWRALKLGPTNMPFFIWLCILDQRISMWTSLLGPTTCVLATLTSGPIFLFGYVAWVLITRTVYLWLLVPRGFVLRPIHFFLQLYDQWVGSALKIGAFMMLNKQSWSKNNNTQSSKKWSMPSWRHYLGMHRLGMLIFAYLLILMLLVGYVRLPTRMHWLSSANAQNLPTPIGQRVIARERDVIPDDGQDDAPALQKLIDDASISEIVLPQGRLDLRSPIKVRRSNLRIVGAGSERTLWVAQFPPTSPDAKSTAVLDVLGGAPHKRLGHLQQDWRAQQGSMPRSGLNLPPQGSMWVFLEADNDAAFLDALGSQKWRQNRPPLRQWMAHFKSTANPIATNPPRIDLPNGTRVSVIQPLEGIQLVGFGIRLDIPGAPNKPKADDYENRYPAYGIDLLRMEWVANSTIEDVNLYNAGRHALVLEHSARIRVKGMKIDGAWNKGAEGNGYLRLARAFECDLSELHVRNIRHVTFQWSASGNTIHHSDLGVDVNFHGGYATHNVVESTQFHVPEHHHWGQISQTPPDARWAPPDGPGNIVRP